MIHYLLIVSDFGTAVLEKKFFLSARPTIDLPPTIGSQLAVFNKHVQGTTGGMGLRHINLGHLSWSMSQMQRLGDDSFFCAIMHDTELDEDYAQLLAYEFLCEFCVLYKGTDRREMSAAESKKFVGAIQAIIVRSLQATVDVIQNTGLFSECHLLCSLPPGLAITPSPLTKLQSMAFVIDKMSVISPQGFSQGQATPGRSTSRLVSRSGSAGAGRRQVRLQSRLNWQYLVSMTAGKPELVTTLSRILKAGRQSFPSENSDGIKNIHYDHTPSEVTYLDDHLSVTVFTFRGAFFIVAIERDRLLAPENRRKNKSIRDSSEERKTRDRQSNGKRNTNESKDRGAQKNRGSLDSGEDECSIQSLSESSQTTPPPTSGSVQASRRPAVPSISVSESDPGSMETTVTDGTPYSSSSSTSAPISRKPVVDNRPVIIGTVEKALTMLHQGVFLLSNFDRGASSLLHTW